MPYKPHTKSARWLGALALAVPVAAATLPQSANAAAPAVKPLYGFCEEASCTDGNAPSGTLLLSGGNLFGTTTLGGQNDKGTIYEIVNNAVTGAHRHKVIYDFCNTTGCADGALPIDGSLIVDSDGSLYGTTSSGGPTGGPDGGGVVFKLKPNANKTHWTYSVVYNFCQDASCRDGLAPVGNLTYFGAASGAAYDKTSPLFGTAAQGGLHNNGVVFSLTPKTDGTFREVPVYFFCSKGGSTCADGQTPTGGLAMDTAQSVAGTTSSGGIGNAGVAFKLNNVGKLRWTETVLHQFCSDDNCSDGAAPRSGLIADAAGNFYGTTTGGGNANDACGAGGCGVAFKIDTHGILSQLYAFCSHDGCADGGVPARLSLDTADNPIGLTSVGGAHHGGTLFRLDAGYQDIFDFKCTKKRCTAGKDPSGGVVEDSENILYGVMQDGGANGGGTVIKYTPPE
ncbi:MAG TPA: choice-of-anchor tandem repeat GloVer-containing protein [Rhizomicrobium sp.]|nr:choice-of-anchor tandem repeat GloVer-containing protein [Rhizomicrobium sp.]